MRTPFPVSYFQQWSFRVAVVLALAGALGGLLVALGWWLPIPVLRIPMPGELGASLTAGILFALTGIGAIGGLVAGPMKRLSQLSCSIVVLVVLWSQSGVIFDTPPLLSREALSLPSSFAFLCLAVAILSLDASSRSRMAVVGVAASVVFLISIYMLGIYVYWLTDPSSHVLLLTTPPQSAALHGLLALAMLIYYTHTLKRPTCKISRRMLGSYGIMGMICLLGWIHFNQLESERARSESEHMAANVSRVLEEHVYRSLDRVGLLLSELGRQVAADGLESITKSERQWQKLKATTESLPQVSAVLIFDSEGEFRFFTRQFPSPGGNYSHRDYFEAHKGGERQYLGELIAAGTSGKPIFTYSHRLSDSDGNFAGVILASLEIDYFRKFYRSLDLGPGAAVGLWRRDGKLLMREPLLPNIENQHLDQHPIYTTLIHKSPKGTFVGYSPYDGEQKLAYYLASNELPFVINTVLGMDHVVIPVEYRFLESTVILAAILAVLAATFSSQLRAVEKTARAHECIKQSQQLNEAVLDSVSAEIAILSPTGVILGVNEAWRQFVLENGAIDKDAFVGRNYLDFAISQEASEDDAESVMEALSAVIAGKKQEFEYIYPCHSPEKERWYRMKVLPMKGAAGQTVVSHESVTVLKQAEAALIRAAHTDQLTGLVNRRGVIEQAESHLANARRYDHPLSVMMIDCDHFKRINDTFGHAGGDEVLRTLAQIMREFCRSGDVLGRFGGEEFVIVLPHTAIEGAKVLAERLRQAVHDTEVSYEELAISFTVSMGVASFRPEMSFAQLLKEADEALHSAKACGRNRVATVAKVE